MLKPRVPIEEFLEIGFKHCKGIPTKQNCLYLCVARGNEMIFVSPEIYDITKWDKNDPRIHKKANCKYKDRRTALDITYEIIKAGYLKEVFG